MSPCPFLHVHWVDDLGILLGCSGARFLLLGTRLKRCGKGDFWISLRFVRTVVVRVRPVGEGAFS